MQMFSQQDCGKVKKLYKNSVQTKKQTLGITYTFHEKLLKPSETNR